MVLYDHLVICPTCKGQGNRPSKEVCGLCFGEGVVTPEHAFEETIKEAAND